MNENVTNPEFISGRFYFSEVELHYCYSWWSFFLKRLISILAQANFGSSFA